MVLVDHSSTGTSGLSETKAHRLTKYGAFQNQLFFMATSASDIFYAKAMTNTSMSVCTEIN